MPTRRNHDGSRIVSTMQECARCHDSVFVLHGIPARSDGTPEWVCRPCADAYWRATGVWA